MVIDRIKHSKPASRRTFLDELEPIPYEISEDELSRMDPRMRRILFGHSEDEDDGVDVIEEEPEVDDEDLHAQAPPAVQSSSAAEVKKLQTAEEKTEPEERKPSVSLEPIADPVNFHVLASEPAGPGPRVTICFPAREDETELLEVARASEYYNETVDDDGRHWHAARFTRHSADALIRLNDLLGERDGAIALFNGKRVPYGRSLWLPLLYIFTAATIDEEQL